MLVVLLLVTHGIHELLLLLLAALEVVNPDVLTVELGVLLNLQVESNFRVDVDHILRILVYDEVVVVDILDDLNRLLSLLSVLLLGLRTARSPGMSTVHLRFDSMVHCEVIDATVVAAALVALVVGKVLRVPLRPLISIASAEPPYRLLIGIWASLAIAFWSLLIVADDDLFVLVVLN